MGLIGENAKLKFILRERNTIVDGKIDYRERLVKGFLTAFSSRDFNEFGVVNDGKNFYISPEFANISLPCEIVYNNIKYSVKQVKPYYNLQGVLLGYKLSSVGIS